jgi:phenylpyruvate tautomerase PptA (4-oxalocrotonate tautomerase family)
MPIFEVTYPEGALTPDARSQLMNDLTTALLKAERAPDTEFFRSVTWSELVEEATALVREAAGIPEEEALRVWVLMHEVAEGSWGAGGQVIQFKQLQAIARKESEEAVPAA